MAASLGETGRRGRLVVDVDAVVRPLDRRWAGRCAEEACKAGGQREKERERFHLTELPLFLVGVFLYSIRKV